MLSPNPDTSAVCITVASKRGSAASESSVDCQLLCAQGTMTGTIHAPTLDTYLARELGLRLDIKRLNVESMGCLTGFRCLALASELAAARPGNTVLTVVCDIRSALGNQLTPHAPGAPVDRANVIASCLFRDSGGAAIVAAPQPQAPLQRQPSWRRRARPVQPLPAAALPQRAERGPQPPVPAAQPPQGEQQAPAESLPHAERPQPPPQYDIIDTRALLVPDSEPLVQYQEREGESIHLYIDKELPARCAPGLECISCRIIVIFKCAACAIQPSACPAPATALVTCSHTSPAGFGASS